MKYRVQRLKGDTLPPKRWLTVEAEDKEQAAISLLRRLKPSAGRFPLTIHVARGKTWPNGAPIATDGITFDLAKDTHNKQHTQKG